MHKSPRALQLRKAAHHASSLAERLQHMARDLSAAADGAPLPPVRTGYPSDVKTPEQLAGFVEELWAKSKRLSSQKLRYLDVCRALVHAEEDFIVGVVSTEEWAVNGLRGHLDSLAPWAGTRLTDEMLKKAVRQLTLPNPAERNRKGEWKRVKRTTFWGVASELIAAAGGGEHTPRSLQTEHGRMK